MRVFLIISLLIVSGFVGYAYAQPLEVINSEVINISDSLSAVQVSWNHDSSVSSYVVGCVSCIPNISENTADDVVILKDITPLKDGSIWLYIIAYDEAFDIISAKQIILST